MPACVEPGWLPESCLSHLRFSSVCVLDERLKADGTDPSLKEERLLPTQAWVQESEKVKDLNKAILQEMGSFGSPWNYSRTLPIQPIKAHGSMANKPIRVSSPAAENSAARVIPSAVTR